MSGPLRVTYPVGVRSLLFGDAERRRRIERQLVDVLAAGGFREIILPIVDFIDPYVTLVSESVMRRTYRFVDREGELIAVRSDFTPMVARTLAPALDDSILPLRVFYRGDVIRYEQTRLGQEREFFQVGAEIVGEPSVAADVETIRLAVDLVRAGGSPPIVTLTDVSLLPRILASAGVDAATSAAVDVAVRDKNAASLEPFRDRLGPRLMSLLREWISGSLTAAGLASVKETAEAAERLSSIERALASSGARVVATLDPLDRERSYYTSLRFQLFSDLRRNPIGGGGRYDDLYSTFGRKAAAVGFTLNVDELEASR